MNNNMNSKPSLIDANTRIEGNIVSKSELRVQGVVNGELSAKHIIVDQKAICNGKLEADTATISGHFDGDITSGHVDIKSTAYVQGQINQKTIAVQSGAIINAQIQTTK